jgi:hypothetical protein
MSAQTVIEAIAVTAELTGTTMTGQAMAVMARELMAAYPEEAILGALSRCRRQLSGRLTPHAVIERIMARDGRPPANEAWAIALSGYDEARTVVMNAEIAEAMAIARPIMQEGDEVGARMAFRDAYERIVVENREANVPVKWFPSIGYDPHGREVELNRAVAQGRLSQEQVAGFLPAPQSLDGQAIAGLLAGPKAATPEETRARIAKLRETFKWGS